MFKKGDEVVAIKREDYELTATERAHGYVSDMIKIATHGKVMTVQRITNRNHVIADDWNWCEEDLELAEEEN